MTPLHPMPSIRILPRFMFHGAKLVSLLLLAGFLEGQTVTPLAEPSEEIEDIIELDGPEQEGEPGNAVDLKSEPLRNFWYWIVGTVLIVLLVLAFLKGKRKAGPVEAVPCVPPHEKALRGLRDAWSHEEGMQDQAYAFALSDVLRLYIEEAFSVRAPERTTEEFLEEAAQHEDLKGEFAARLEEFLSLVDLVKFARMPLETRAREELYDSAVQFVEESHQSCILKIAPELSVSSMQPQVEETVNA